MTVLNVPAVGPGIISAPRAASAMFTIIAGNLKPVPETDLMEPGIGYARMGSGAGPYRNGACVIGTARSNIGDSYDKEFVGLSVHTRDYMRSQGIVVPA